MPATNLTPDIEGRIAEGAPQIEVLLVEVVAKDTLRVFIDHADGVSLAHCEQVTGLLEDYRDRYVIEVSSPGAERPLTKPEHFNRFLGKQARLRVHDTRDGQAPKAKRLVNVTGELVGASDSEVTIAAREGVVSIPYTQIARSNLVPGE